MNKENLEELPKFPCENISELKTLLFLKSKYLKKFNFEMDVYIKFKKVSELYENDLGDKFYDSCMLEVDMKRTLEIIYKLDHLIHNIELGENVFSLDDYKSYAKYILKRDENINV